MKTVLIILDGIADLPCKELKGKTPLEVAKTPNLDFLAKNGKTGYMYPVKESIAPESDVAVTSILGYDPYKYFIGRGQLEAFGAGIKTSPGDLALRTNFATVKDNIVVERRAGRTLATREAQILAKTINKKVKLRYPFIFKPTIQHRGVLVIRGGFSDNISNIDPAYERYGSFGVAHKTSNKLKVCKPMDDEETTRLSANLVNIFFEQSKKILKDHPVNKKRKQEKLLPANAILLRGAGTSLPYLPKKQRRWAAIVAMPLEMGLTKLAGMNILSFKYPKMKTKNVYENLYYGLAIRVRIVRKYLKKYFNKYDAFYIHFKETDVPGHDGLPLEKKKMLEFLDKGIFSFIKDLKDTLIVVTADHSTPCKLKAHSADPVPLLIYGKGKDKVEKFSEKACMKGSIGKIYGKNLLKLCGF